MINHVMRELLESLHRQPLSDEMVQRLMGMLDWAEAKPVFEMLIPEAEWRGRHPFPPSCETEESAGYDLPAFLYEPVTIGPGDTKVIRTGWSVWMPAGVECQVRSRSGLAAKYGVSVLNSPGTVEPDYYPNDIKVILHNGGPEPFVVNHGDRIAQAVFAKFLRADGAVHKTTTREGGLGHTGR